MVIEYNDDAAERRFEECYAKKLQQLQVELDNAIKELQDKHDEAILTGGNECAKEAFGWETGEDWEHD